MSDALLHVQATSFWALEMTSKSSKEQRLLESAIKRAKLHQGLDPTDPTITPPPGALPADQSALEHNNTHDRLPAFYVDKIVVCRGCGKEEVWKAENQKWWYEVIKGDINTKAVSCRSCRAEEKARKELARRTHLAGVERKAKKKEIGSKDESRTLGARGQRKD